VTFSEKNILVAVLDFRTGRRLGKCEWLYGTVHTRETAAEIHRIHRCPLASKSEFFSQRAERSIGVCNAEMM